MGQTLSSRSPHKHSAHIRLMRYAEIRTRLISITSVKAQPGGALVAVASELGFLALFSILEPSPKPVQHVVLKYEYGGISEILWISNDMLAIGTTRGNIIIFSMKSASKALFNVGAVDAHGDGAAEVAVQSLHFARQHRLLVSVAQGATGIRLWHITDEGKISRKSSESHVFYCQPRFSLFINEGAPEAELHILVGFLDSPMIQKFDAASLQLTGELHVGEDDFAVQSQIANGVLLPNAGKIAVFDLAKGLVIYDGAKIEQLGRVSVKVDPYCAQGVCSLRNGEFVGIVSTSGKVEIYETNGISHVLSLRMSPKWQGIKAIEATSHEGDDVVIAASGRAGEGSVLSVFANDRFIEKRRKAQAEKEPLRQGSTIHMLFLCLTICAALNVAVILLLFPEARTAFPFLKATAESTDNVASLGPTQEELLSWSNSLYAMLHGVGDNM